MRVVSSLCDCDLVDFVMVGVVDIDVASADLAVDDIIDVVVIFVVVGGVVASVGVDVGDVSLVVVGGEVALGMILWHFLVLATSKFEHWCG